MPSFISASIHHLKHAIDRSGYVLVIASSLIMWWGIYTVADGTIRAGAISSQTVALSPRCVTVQYLSLHQQDIVNPLWPKLLKEQNVCNVKRERANKHESDKHESDKHESDTHESVKRVSGNLEPA